MASFLMCLSLNLGEAQANRPPVKQQDSAAQLLAQSADAFERGDLANAKTILQKVLKADVHNITAHTLLGAIADRENDLRTAELHFSQAAKFSPKSPETRNNYGAILLRLNRQPEAAAEFAASLAANPNQQSALVNLAQIRFAENKLVGARELFEKAKLIAPDAEILRALVIISLRSKDKDAAARDFQEYAEVIKKSPTVGESGELHKRLEFGAELFENDKLSEAQIELEDLNAVAPDNVEVLVLLSRIYLAQQNVRLAGRILESAVARGIESAKIYESLANVYQTGGYMENAVPAMRLAIEKDPKNEFYRARYGLLLISAKAPAAAIIRLKEAVAEMPDSARLWLALGIAQLTEGGKAADAQTSFENSLRLEPKSIPALAYLGTIYTDAANYAEAAKNYERALLIEENNALLHYLLADTLLKMPESDPAIIEKHLRRAIALDEKLSSAHFALGKVYARAEHWQEASEEFRKTVNYAPEFAEGHYQLGRTLTRLKQPAAANLEFEKYKKLNDSQSAQKEIDRRELVRRLANVKF
ncbi:MAG: tetratricopeptide repeat protein [Pyrinomonadaceae bacterium]